MTLQEQLETIFYPIAGKVTALDLIMRAFVANAAARQDGDPCAWMEGFTTSLIESMHAAPLPVGDLVELKMLSFAEVELRTFAEAVKGRLHTMAANEAATSASPRTLNAVQPARAP